MTGILLVAGVILLFAGMVFTAFHLIWHWDDWRLGNLDEPCWICRGHYKRPEPPTSRDDELVII